jgi:predicted anti-sigma-YlaC factor YlaD
MAAALDGPLDAIDEAAVSRHVRDCHRCRTIASAYAADATHLREVAAVAPPGWVAAVVIEAASKAAPAGRRSSAPVRSALRWALIGLVFVVALLVVLSPGLR